MSHWTSFILPFALGFAAGTGICFALLASRIRFYKKFIEQRLAAINRTISTQSSAGGPSKSAVDDAPWSRRSGSDKGSNPFENN